MSNLKVGLVGCGAIGRDHIRRINEVIQGAEISAISDVFIEGGRKIADQWGVEFFADGEEMIKSDKIDAVIITTLDQFHEKYAISAIKEGKHVFCEKPLAPDADSCKRIMQAEISNGRHLLQVGFMRRYDSGYRTLKDIIEKHMYGQPLILHCAHRAVSIAPNYVTSMLITNCAVHEIDVLHWLLNENYRNCQVVQPKPTKNAWTGLNDPVILLLETETGVRIDIEVFVNCRYGYDIRCEVVCEDGTVSLPTPTGVLVRTAGERFIPVSDDWRDRFADAYDQEFIEWVSDCKNDIVSGPTAWDGYVCSVTATTAVKALDTGCIEPISLDECPEFYR